MKEGREREEMKNDEEENKRERKRGREEETKAIIGYWDRENKRERG